MTLRFHALTTDPVEAATMAGDDSLVDEWKTLYSQTLPALAKARDPVQSKWPVSLDHCFARIILDNTIGKGTKQWDRVISKPAIRNMSEDQLRNAIELGNQIRDGKINLCELDQISLLCRGKNEAKYSTATAKPAKRKHDDEAIPTDKQRKLDFTPLSDPVPRTKRSPSSNVDFAAVLQRIQSHKSLTSYRKRLYTILLSVPSGRYTTYAKMSDYLHSSARAVGNGMRNNPFAPDVPCHRVLAADGSLGGFHGHWGREGKYANDKLKLLRDEGVRFDGKGKVVGTPFTAFHEFEERT